MESPAEFYAVVPAGGSGTRLWPLSRASAPKFLHPLTGGERSLLQATVDRVAPLAPPSRTLVVTGASHAVGVARQLPQLDADQIIVEPSPRDSAPAIGLAATLIHRRNPQAVMGSFAADHRVTDIAAFLEAVRTAIDVANAGYLVTIGLTPTHAETGYGYIHQAKPLDAGGYGVAEFKEKPHHELAQSYVDSGEYLWNASMFVWRVATLLSELERQSPELAAGLARIADDWDTPRRDETLARIWPTLPKIAIDYAVMEGSAEAGLVATVPADIGWNDVGDWHSLGAILSTDPTAGDGESGNIVIGSSSQRIYAIDSHDCVVVPQGGRAIALLGLHDAIIVDTPDAMLVATRDRAQDVKKLVDQLPVGDPLR